MAVSDGDGPPLERAPFNLVAGDLYSGDHRGRGHGDHRSLEGEREGTAFTTFLLGSVHSADAIGGECGVPSRSQKCFSRAADGSSGTGGGSDRGNAGSESFG